MITSQPHDLLAFHSQLYPDTSRNTQVSSLLVQVVHHSIQEERECAPGESKEQEIYQPRIAPLSVASVKQVVLHT